jgi:hypothetical protein
MVWIRLSLFYFKTDSMNRKLRLEFKTLEGKVKTSYEVEYPTIGQMMDVESLKLAYSKGKYTEMILSGTKWMSRVLNYVDMLAYFTVMCPDLIKDSKVDLANLDLLDVHKGMLGVYKDQFLPWWNEYEAMISKLESGEDIDEDKTSDDKE